MSDASAIGDDLLDEARSAGEPRARFWEPTRELVVLGRANDPETECRTERCRERGVEVLRRRGGGGTVLLAPGMLVLTLAGPGGTTVRPARTFERLNAWIADALVAAGAPRLAPRGTSDLCVGDRKVLGCSLAFSRGLVLYQGVLLVSADLAPLDELLRHPSREPDYRAGRSHLDFVTTLAAVGGPTGVGELAAHLRSEFERQPPFPVTVGDADSSPPARDPG